MKPKKAKLMDLIGKEIWFIRVINRKNNRFPNNEFSNTVCYPKYNDEDEDIKHFQYMMVCSRGNAYLNDGTDTIEYYTKESNPEYFL